MATAKSTKQKIVMPSIDLSDPKNTQPNNRSFEHFGHNFALFSKHMFKSVMKSKLFWGLLVILPMIATLLETIIFAEVITSGFHHSYGVDYISVKVTNNIVSIVRLDFINYFFTMPLLVLGLITFPTFITQSREDNLLKRLRLAGSTKSQMYLFYILFAATFTIVVTLAWLIIWIPICWIVVNLIASTSASGLSLDNPVYDNPWLMFGAVKGETYMHPGIAIEGLDMIEFIPIVIASLIGMTSFGYKKSMNATSSKSILMTGIGIWIFASMCSGFTSLLNTKTYGSNLISSSVFWSFLVNTLTFFLKWMFLLTYGSIFSVAITISIGGAPMPGTGTLTKDTVETTYLVIEILSIFVAIYLTAYSLILREKIFSFETTR